MKASLVELLSKSEFDSNKLLEKRDSPLIIAFVGVIIMIYNDSLGGSVLGALLGFASATGFAVYTVTIRWRPQTPKFTTVFLAGLFCAAFSFIMLGASFNSFI